MTHTILGIDPGLAATGWSVLCGPTLIDCGQWSYDDPDDAARAALYCGSLVEVIRDRAVTVLAIEGQFATMPSKDVPEAVARSMARAALRLNSLTTRLIDAAKSAGIRDEEGARHVLTVAPASAKKHLAFSGRATKGQMIAAVRSRYGIVLAKSREHIADAIGIGLAGGAKLQAAELGVRIGAQNTRRR